MSGTLRIAGGLALSLAGWGLLRIVAGAEFGSAVALALDLAPVLLGWGIGFAAAARPLCAGAAILALACGLALADRTKRQVLREPIVFSDSAELLQVFTNPELYLPFVPRGLFYGGGAALIAGALALALLEPPLWRVPPWQPPLVAAAFAGLVWCLSHAPLLGIEAAWLRSRLPPSDDPARDAARYGPLTALLLYGTIARFERPARQAAAAPRPEAPALCRGHRPPPIVIVQSESFFDARRVHPGIATGLLPNFDRLRRRAHAHGRLAVPGWGANTMRTEFAVMTGFGPEAIGFDRFNPYHAFARRALESLVWQLRRSGYRTVCVHPYERRFYRRDLILPKLGFERYVGIEAFADAERVNGFVSDAALARFLEREIATADDGLLLYAMTIENHGPWRTDPADLPLAEATPGLPDAPDFVELRRYLGCLQHADRMLGRVATAIERRHEEGLLAFYGDHLPSLPAAFDRLGFTETTADYLVWSPRGGPGAVRDLAAHELTRLILDGVERSLMSPAQAAG